MASMISFWKGKRVLITGHTGFKGSWLSLWLQALGAEVTGYSLKPPSEPSLYYLAGVATGMVSVEADIRDLAALQSCLKKQQPEIVIHMAAQSLVRHSYQYPIETLTTNIIGTANLLEAVRYAESVRAVINVTSDKCYDNREWVWGYRENDPMGGYDPYSCSKGCSELITSSYRRSFFQEKGGVNIASARAGNVIGGGDWAEDRIVPDSIRAIASGELVTLRNPDAIRPWQHVLEPLAGYLLLAEKLWDEGSKWAEGWNFGPDESHAWTVRDLVGLLCQLWGAEAGWNAARPGGVHEAQYLKLDSSKARQLLGWKPVLSMRDTVEFTVDWYKRYYQGNAPRTITLEQIALYQNKYEENGYGKY